MPLCPILHAGWCQLGISAFTMHDQFIPPIAPAFLPSIPGLLEGPVPMGWAPGQLSHMTAEQKVLVDGAPGVQQGHDIGYVIPHIALPPNALCVVHTLISKHKVMFPVTDVQLAGNPAGTYLAFLLGLICANPVSLPTGVVMLLKCTVWTKLSPNDFWRGLLRIAVDVAYDLAWNNFKDRYIPQLLAHQAVRSQHWAIIAGFSPKLGKVVKTVPGLLARRLLLETGDRVISHVLDNWLVSPLTTSLPQGQTGIGRGNRFSYTHNLFSSPL